MTEEMTLSDISFNEEGYMTNLDQWTPDVARELARANDIELTDKHFEVLNFLREATSNGEKLSIRRIGKSGIVDIKGFYALFPGAPLKLASKLAGIPKPTSCV
ncbi:MAG: sulfur relay protein DsrC [Bacteroidetes bacterium CG12_big_fil_rev_8_21_14_0_65_60_17]|nr:MAG: sulfur relay protein DsrC [Bacteroidetes bacterium CG12_big_fil_rev_8_21_14_0_65_60_17]